jgi:quercetin dioxygenase-like cupin family protein
VPVLIFFSKLEAEENEMAENLQNIFGQGIENPYGQYFIGKSYLNMLNDKGVLTCNVTFEPGCRNNWHVHHADKGGGQILLCTEGRGWYQEWGKPAQALNPGDVVYIAPEIKHWHGAAADSWFVHVALEVPGENTSNEWLEAVDDEQYAALTK